jgi:hypothetical protein
VRRTALARVGRRNLRRGHMHALKGRDRLEGVKLLLLLLLG